MRTGFFGVLGVWLAGAGLALAQSPEFQPAQGYPYPGAPQVYPQAPPAMQAPMAYPQQGYYPQQQQGYYPQQQQGYYPQQQQGYYPPMPMYNPMMMRPYGYNPYAMGMGRPMMPWGGYGSMMMPQMMMPQMPVVYVQPSAPTQVVASPAGSPVMESPQPVVGTLTSGHPHHAPVTSTVSRRMPAAEDAAVGSSLPVVSAPVPSEGIVVHGLPLSSAELPHMVAQHEGSAKKKSSWTWPWSKTSKTSSPVVHTTSAKKSFWLPPSNK